MRKFIVVVAASVITCPIAAMAATTFTASATNANGSLQTTVTWNSDRESCVASGSEFWNGAKAKTGTVTLPQITMSGTYVLTLTCSTSANDSAALTWVNPTKNTDGSALTNLGSTIIKYGKNGSSPDLSKSTPAPGTTTTIEGLAPGEWFFSATSVTTDGIESAPSNQVKKTITAAVSDDEKVTLVVNPVPSPPSNLTIQ